MKKFYFCIAIIAATLFSIQSTKAEGLDLTFDRTGTTASSVIVNTTGVEGVTATLVSASHDFRNTAGSITSSIICPNVNGNTYPTITLEFSITGLPADYKISSLDLDIHALNGSNGYQEPNDGKKRMFSVAADIDGDTFGSLNNIDIAERINPTGSIRHDIWTITPAASVTATSPLSLTLTISSGTMNEGCFFGLAGITLNQDNTVDISDIYIDNTENQETVIYDLYGRRLNAPVRGINIINGVKVLVK